MKREEKHEAIKALSDDELKSQVDAIIEHGSPLELKSMKANLSAWRKRVPDGRRTKLDSDLRRINRRLEYLEQQNRTVPAPRTAVQTELMSRAVVTQGAEGLQSWFEFGEDFTEVALDGEKTTASGGTIAAEFETKLATREAGYIQDAVFSFARRFFDGEETPLVLEGKYYVLRCTFDDFCREGGISGSDRQAVRKALEEDLLGEVKFIIPKGPKGPYTLTKRYISRRTTVKQVLDKTGNLVVNRGLGGFQKAKETITAFELDIDASLFSFLNGRRGTGGRGFLSLPMQLNRKIDAAFERSRWLATNEFHKTEVWNQTVPAARGGLRVLERSGPEDFRACLVEIFRKWEAGKEKRTGPMIVTWRELSDKGLLRKHSKDASRRKEDMAALMFLLLQLQNFGDLKTRGIFFHPSGQELHLHAE